MSRSLTRDLLLFEWRYHARQLTFLAATLLVAGAGLMLVASGYGPAGVHVNSPYVVMQSLGLLSLAVVFVLTIFCSNAALRDVEHGMLELVFAKPITKPRYVLLRFAGAVTAAMAIMAITALLMMIAPLLLSGDPVRVGAVRPLAYAWALLIIVLPNVILSAALLYSVATLSRSTLATYVAAIAIYALYLVASMIVDSPLMAGAAPPTAEGLARAALLDPFGLSAFFEQTRYWTVAERNERLLSFTGRVVWNRLLWLAVASATVAVTYRLFAFRVGSAVRTGSRAVRRASRAAMRKPASSTPAPVHPYRTVTPARARVFVPALLSATRLEVKHLLAGRTFRAVLVLWLFVALMQATSQLAGGEYGTRVLPYTGLMIDAMRIPLMLLGTIAIVYYAAELVWRERSARVHALIDVTPASNGVFFTAKAFALCAVPVIMTILAIVVGVVVQVANGYGDVQLPLYLSQFLTAAFPLALFAIAAIALQIVARNRWIGMVAGLIVGVVARQGESLGIHHPMLRFGAAPAVHHSDMSGFGTGMASFPAFMLYWTAAGAVLACITWLLWRRGEDTALRARWRGTHGGRRRLRALTVACAVFATAAGALLWQTNVAHAWRGQADDESWRSAYERSYRRLASATQPSVVAVQTAVDLFPDQQRAAISATYRMVNTTTVAIDTLWVAIPRDVELVSVSAAGGTVVHRDERLGMYAIALQPSLGPGAASELRFSLRIDRSGIRADDRPHDITANGTFFRSMEVFPGLGYNPAHELADPRTRAEHGLSAEPTPIPRLDTLAVTDEKSRAAHPRKSWVSLDAVISTSHDQTAFTAGDLVRRWSENGRSYFHYVTAAPVTPILTFASGRYDVSRVTHDDVVVEVWHHPSHTANVARILKAATLTLDVMGERFGQYPHAALRIVETPSWSNFGAFAGPGIVYFREDGGFLTDADGGSVDLVARRTAHEVAHQWWGHLVDPADVEGAPVLIESLAKYAEQRVVARLHGESALTALLAFDEDRYLAGRAQESDGERALMYTAGEAYLYYGKGAIVLNALRDLLGEDALDSALRRIIAAHGGPAGAATSADLRAFLREAAPTAQARGLVDEWLGDRVTYDMRVDSAVSTPVAATAAGESYRVRAVVRVSKSATRAGGEQSLNADGESLVVAVYDNGEPWAAPLHLQRHVVRGGRIILDVAVARAPGAVVVDPDILRIDRSRSNNRKVVTLE